MAAAVAGVAHAARVLARLGLVDAFGHVSAREGDAVLITPAASLGDVGPGQVLRVPLDAGELPPGVPGEAWLHLAVYRARADVAAIARAQPASALAVGASVTALPPVHGQAAWLGAALPVHPVPRLLRDPDLAHDAARTLGDADAMVLRGNGAVAVGAHPGLAVARMHVLDTACRVWASARDPVPLGDDDVAAWRAAAPALLERLWRHLATSVHEGGPGPDDDGAAVDGEGVRVRRVEDRRG